MSIQAAGRGPALARRQLPTDRWGGMRRVLRPGALRAVVEIKTVLRTPEAAFFLVVLPILLLVIFGPIFTDPI